VTRTYIGVNLPVAANRVALFPDVEGLFDIIDDAIERRAAQLLVQYDPDLGHPITIRIDYSRLTADDEVEYLISDFEVR
jgi:hypothetical protein